MMDAEMILAEIADRLQWDVEDGTASDELRDVYLIAIRRMCPRCEGKPEDGPRCVVTGALHPWVHTDQTDGSS
ncbi:hypothetical protein IT882_13190 [Microbacterium schleiferi]|uniref:Uncharacterized protein n=1 Tax=Microbacterium schleiferi TaxID=69362 RepID=A0A7S8RHA4_9MICO|nr:hypothetical protein [Microbacterium schleiferi]QPE04146.1 hypothetical protein IT882_13190 [Microbacterium schleiferi]